ncbi:hypothetical protein DIPPA_11433 [Diplonema papillatum]|nr:hypothetical protein DIPPA_11433 [Diplonema papillatum]|eukprot:gene11392-17523_t
MAVHSNVLNAERAAKDAAQAVNEAAKKTSEATNQLDELEKKESQAAQALADASSAVSSEKETLRQMLTDMIPTRLKHKETLVTELGRQIEHLGMEKTAHGNYIQQLEERIVTLRQSAVFKENCKVKASTREDALRQRIADAKARLAAAELKLAA